MPEASDTTTKVDSAKRSSPGLRFVVTAAFFSLTLFGILRIPFVEQYLLLPFTKAQHGLACRIGGDPSAPIAVGLSCSAADVIALCLGFILAFPVPWISRLKGAVVGLMLIAAVNTVRIATLSHAVSNTRWFDLLHVYLWPAILLVVVSVYVFLWMSRAIQADAKAGAATSRNPDRFSWSKPSVRFVVLTLLFVVLFVGSSGWWMKSPGVLTVANWVAAAGAFLIRLFGGEASVTGNILRTTNGSFRVTQECIMTPLIPTYFAAVLALPMARSRRVAFLLAALPVFFLLGAARLLVLAFPARLVGSHLMAIHGFFQILLAFIIVILATMVSSTSSRSRRQRIQSILLAISAGSLTAITLGWTYNRALFAGISWLRQAAGHPGHDYMDPQSALLLMAPYQIGLCVALWLAWSPRASPRRLIAGVVILGLLQILVLFGLGEWVAHTGLTPHVAMIRAWTVISTVLLAAWLLTDLGKREPRKIRSVAQAQHG